MNSSTGASEPRAVTVRVTRESLTVDLVDGRTVIAPIAWYPRLLNATNEERRRWRLIGGGEGIHWPDIDEDISVEGLLAGRPSGESQESFRKWLDGRTKPPATRSRPAEASNRRR